MKVEDRFTIKGRGEQVIYRLVNGEVRVGMELVSADYGDRWSVASDAAFIDPPPPEGFVRPPFALLHPLGQPRQTDLGEVFYVVGDESPGAA